MELFALELPSAGIEAFGRRVALMLYSDAKIERLTVSRPPHTCGAGAGAV
jgi:hypothetical protein